MLLQSVTFFLLKTIYVVLRVHPGEWNYTAWAKPSMTSSHPPGRRHRRHRHGLNGRPCEPKPPGRRRLQVEAFLQEVAEVRERCWDERGGRGVRDPFVVVRG